MIMKKLLLIIWCIKLSTEKLLKPEYSVRYIFSDKQSKDLQGKWPYNKNILEHVGLLDPNSAATALKTVRKYHKQNGHKNEQSYRITVFKNSEQKTHEQPDFSKTIPDINMIYHSKSNPLFRSNSLDLGDFSTVGDRHIHKLSNPFESKWIFFPPKKSLGSSNPLLGVKTFNLNADKFKFANDEIPIDTLLTPSYSHFKLPNQSNTNNILNISALNNFYNKFKITESDFNDVFDNGINLVPDLLLEKKHDSKNRPEENSFHSYDFSQVNKGDGKTHGIMQIFDKNGLKEKVHYNENGVFNKTLMNSTTPYSCRPTTNKIKSNTDVKINSEDNQLQNVIQKAVNHVNNRARTVKNASKVDAKKPSSETAQNATELHKPSISNNNNNLFNNEYTNFLPNHEFLKPENILPTFHFMEQLGGLNMPVLDNTTNVITKKKNSFEESYKENSYYHVKK